MKDRPAQLVGTLQMVMQQLKDEGLLKLVFTEAREEAKPMGYQESF